MGWFKKIKEWFVRDSAARKRFIDEFNENAKMNFTDLKVGSLLEAEICRGNEDSKYRHELSAPIFASGFEIQVRAGSEISVDDILLIGTIILCDESIVRRMYILHWDTLIIRDLRTDRHIDWAIKDFVNLGGLLASIRQNIGQNNR
jgi:hypothetical protein